MFKNVKYILLLFCIGFGHNSHAQTNLIRFEEVHFENRNERMAIYNLIRGGQDYFEALSIAEGIPDTTVSNWKAEFYDHLAAFKAKERKRNNWIYLNRLYRDLHESYLVKYNEGANIFDTFENGSFNCVAACAIYSMAFEELEIPYIIKEMPDHVYIVGLSKRGPMLFETNGSGDRF